jgi:hypothetical protein
MSFQRVNGDTAGDVRYSFGRPPYLRKGLAAAVHTERNGVQFMIHRAAPCNLLYSPWLLYQRGDHKHRKTQKDGDCHCPSVRYLVRFQWVTLFYHHERWAAGDGQKQTQQSSQDRDAQACATDEKSEVECALWTWRLLWCIHQTLVHCTAAAFDRLVHCLFAIVVLYYFQVCVVRLWCWS